MFEKFRRERHSILIMGFQLIVSGNVKELYEILTGKKRIKTRVSNWTYNKVNWGENTNCPISSPVSICQDGSNKGSKIASSSPSSDISRCRDISFVQLFRKISNKISGNSIVSQTFTALGTCNVYYKNLRRIASLINETNIKSIRTPRMKGQAFQFPVFSFNTRFPFTSTEPSPVKSPLSSFWKTNTKTIMCLIQWCISQK